MSSFCFFSCVTGSVRSRYISTWYPEKYHRHVMLGVGIIMGFPICGASFYNSDQTSIVGKLPSKLIIINF